ncbi:MAG: head GIN domain-containing protein [Chloroflexota bacterium]
MNTKSLVTITTALCMIFISACGSLADNEKTIQPSGNLITEERDLSGFDQINLIGVGEVIITQGQEESLSIRADENFMPFVEVDVKGSVLTLGLDTSDEGVTIRVEDDAYGAMVVFDLVVKDINQIDISDAFGAKIDQLETDKLQIDLSGVGTLDINSLVADQLSIHQSGAGAIIISGQVNHQEIVQSGVGNFHAGGLESDTAVLNISGAGDATVWVKESLDVDISGVGNVVYFGSPQITSKISGVGKLVNTE